MYMIFGGYYKEPKCPQCPPKFQQILSGICIILTVVRHANSKALCETAVLAFVSGYAHDDAISRRCTCFVCNIVLDGSPEEPLKIQFIQEMIWSLPYDGCTLKLDSIVF